MRKGCNAWAPVSRSHLAGLRESRFQALRSPMLPTEHSSQSVCLGRAQTMTWVHGYLSQEAWSGRLWRPLGAWSVCPATPPVLGSGLPPSSFPDWCCSLYPESLSSLNLPSFYGVRGNRGLLRRHEANCARLFQTSMPGNLPSILLNTHPFLKPLEMRSPATKEAFITHPGTHDNCPPNCLHHALNLVGPII